MHASTRRAGVVVVCAGLASCAALDQAIGPPEPPRGEERMPSPVRPAPTAIATSPGARSQCEPFGSVAVGTEYFVQNNAWNTNQEQCIAVGGEGATDPTRFVVTRAGFHLSTSGPPASYPAIVKGCHWGHCTAPGGMPVRADAIESAFSSWEVSHPPGSAFDVAYDLWFHKSPTTGGQPDAAELMIWLDHGGGVQPAGGRVASVSIDGARWEVWTDDMEWKYVAYVRDPPTDRVQGLDLRAFVDDAVGRRLVAPTAYLIAVEAGFEIWQGGVGFESRAFRASVTPRAPNRAP